MSCSALGMAIEHPEGAHEFDKDRGRADEAVEETVHREAEERCGHDDGDDEGGPVGPLRVYADVEDQRRRIGLGPVGEVEHT